MDVRYGKSPYRRTSSAQTPASAGQAWAPALAALARRYNAPPRPVPGSQRLHGRQLARAGMRRARAAAAAAALLAAHVLFALYLACCAAAAALRRALPALPSACVPVRMRKPELKQPRFPMGR